MAFQVATKGKELALTKAQIQKELISALLKDLDLDSIVDIIAQAFSDAQKRGFVKMVGYSCPSPEKITDAIMARLQPYLDRSVPTTLADNKEARKFLNDSIYPLFRICAQEFTQYDEAWLIRLIVSTLKEMSNCSAWSGLKMPQIPLHTAIIAAAKSSKRPIIPYVETRRFVNELEKKYGIFGRTLRVGIPGHVNSYPDCSLGFFAAMEKNNMAIFLPFVITIGFFIFSIVRSLFSDEASSLLILKNILESIFLFAGLWLGLRVFLPNDKSPFELQHMVGSFREGLRDGVRNKLIPPLEELHQARLARVSQLSQKAAEPTAIAATASLVAVSPPFASVTETIDASPTLKTRFVPPRGVPRSPAIVVPSLCCLDRRDTPPSCIRWPSLINPNEYLIFSAGELNPNVLEIYTDSPRVHFLYFNKEELSNTLFKKYSHELLDSFYKVAVGGQVRPGEGFAGIIDCRKEVKDKIKELTHTSGVPYVYKLKPLGDTPLRLFFYPAVSIEVGRKTRVLFFPGALRDDKTG